MAESLNENHIGRERGEKGSDHIIGCEYCIAADPMGMED